MHHVSRIDWSFVGRSTGPSQPPVPDRFRPGSTTDRRTRPGRRPHRDRRRRNPSRRLARTARPFVRGGAVRPRGRAPARPGRAGAPPPDADYALIPTGTRHSLGNAGRAPSGSCRSTRHSGSTRRTRAARHLLRAGPGPGHRWTPPRPSGPRSATRPFAWSDTTTARRPSSRRFASPTGPRTAPRPAWTRPPGLQRDLGEDARRSGASARTWSRCSPSTTRSAVPPRPTTIRSRRPTSSSPARSSAELDGQHYTLRAG